MKKSIRLYLTGTVQSLFFREFIKKNAEANDVKGFFRNRDDGRAEIFLEGSADNVNRMIEICKRGPQHAQIRNIEEKEERLQDFKEFKILNF